MKTITVEELLSKWWDTHLETKDEVNALDWDGLLNAIGINVTEYKGKFPIIGDFDTDGRTVHVSFTTELIQ